MMQIKFQCYRPFGAREEDFLRFFPYMAISAILVIRPGPVEQIFIVPSHSHIGTMEGLSVHAFCLTGDENIIPTCRSAGNYYILVVRCELKIPSLEITVRHHSASLVMPNRTIRTSQPLNGPRQANLVFIAYASSEGSGEPAHPRSLARTFAARPYKQ